MNIFETVFMAKWYSVYIFGYMWSVNDLQFQTDVMSNVICDWLLLFYFSSDAHVFLGKAAFLVHKS